MTTNRFFYSDSVEYFINKPSETIIGELTRSTAQDINKDTTNSWEEEIKLLQPVLADYRGRGSVYFEYNIPRMGRRADVIVIIDGIVFVLEFKTSSQQFTRYGYTQVWDYALDLKNFHVGSRDRKIVPVLVCPSEKDRKCKFDQKPFGDNVYEPLYANGNRLKECIDNVLMNVDGGVTQVSDDDWSSSGYEPTPTIIEASVALYSKHSVEDITRHDGDIDNTIKAVNDIVTVCRENKRKAICFVTGVPGAGKTLIGLQVAIQHLGEEEKAVYLSGNGPLVTVLQEALARDYVRKEKEKYKMGMTSKKPQTKAEATSIVKTFIQMIHDYRDLYLVGMEVAGGELRPEKDAFKGDDDKAYVPTEHVAIFDEAQRAWTKESLAGFMSRKKSFKNFPYSEPEYLISCVDRHKDWGVVICLIGGGQEINSGEAGIGEWIDSLNRSFPHWHVYMSDSLHEREYANGEAVEKIDRKAQLHIVPSLHLKVSMRSFRAEKVSDFVHHLLELNKEEAAVILKELSQYHIVLTRSLDKAKKWLRDNRRGSERCGLLASSTAERLKAISINVRYKPQYVHWFLDDVNDIRSSNALEDTLTEFDVQGLEIDWACVAWDVDLRLNSDCTAWQQFRLKGKGNWGNINKEINKAYQINAYRVLLTRARQGMVILVPEGDRSETPDETRKPEWYDRIYKYLKEIGIKEI